MSSSTYITLIFIVVVSVNLWSNNRKRPKPPGPRGLPIIGNLLEMPTDYGWETFGKMGETYGPLISLSIGPTTIVVINTYQKAKEVLDKKGAIYSSRPYLAMPGDLMGWQKSTALMETSPDLIQTRKMYHQELGSTTQIRAFWPQQESQARQFLVLCVDHPENLMHNCFIHSGALILRIVYGYTAAKDDDEMVDLAKKAIDSLNVSAVFVVNQLPFLRYLPEWFPGAGFKRIAREWAQLYLNMVDVPMNYVRDQITAGTAEESFCAKYLRENISAEQTELLRHASGALVGAGTEATAATMHCFFLMMALHPEAQRKAQTEIDAICGHDRLPTFQDREHLPYVDALIKEVSRIHPTIPLGVPHTAIENDIVDGYYIPKGSVVMSNIWQMARDGTVYDRPLTFEPERFMGPTPQQDPYELIFGFGRRVCPGRLLADSSLYITIAMCLSVFDIGFATDANGVPIEPKVVPVSGIVGSLAEFPCKLAPRLPKDNLEQLIRN